VLRVILSQGHELLQFLNWLFRKSSSMCVCLKTSHQAWPDYHTNLMQHFTASACAPPELELCRR
jgi:hypothetical protein